MDYDPETLKQWDREHVWDPFTQMQGFREEVPLIISREGIYLYEISRATATWMGSLPCGPISTGTSAGNWTRPSPRSWRNWLTVPYWGSPIPRPSSWPAVWWRLRPRA